MTKWQGWEFYGAYILTGLTGFTGLSSVGVVSSSSRVELGDFAKVAVEGLTVLCQNFRILDCEEVRSDIPKHMSMKADTLKEKIEKYMTVKIIRYSERRNK